jgi:hypothetical protein
MCRMWTVRYLNQVSNASRWSGDSRTFFHASAKLSIASRYPDFVDRNRGLHCAALGATLRTEKELPRRAKTR